MQAQTFAELQHLSREELVNQYDAHTRHTYIGLGFIREEIFRRDQERTAAPSEILPLGILSRAAGVARPEHQRTACYDRDRNLRCRQRGPTVGATERTRP